MVYSTLCLIVTLFVAIDQVLPQAPGFGFFFGEGDKNFFETISSNQEDKKRDEGRKKIRFVLWNRKNQSWIQTKYNGTAYKTVWQKDVPLKLIIHSYSSEVYKAPPEIMEKQRITNIGYAYGNVSNETNIEIVDWTPLSLEYELQYKFVVGSVPLVGEVVAEHILKLMKLKLLSNLTSVHMIGFGLGAHVAAVAGKLIQKDAKYGGKVGRITGLDPAGVGFDDDTGQKAKNKSISLGKYDAEFVDVIHCNLGLAKTIQDAKWKGRFGSAVQAGHIDFYPNGGTDQRACKKVDDMIEKECNTRACPYYFTKSIEGLQYVGCECQDYDDFMEGNCDCNLDNGGMLMGEHCTKEGKGKYFLTIETIILPTKKPKVLTLKGKPTGKKDEDHDHDTKHKGTDKKKGKTGTTTTAAPKKKGDKKSTKKPKEEEKKKSDEDKKSKDDDKKSKDDDKKSKDDDKKSKDDDKKSKDDGKKKGDKHKEKDEGKKKGKDEEKKKQKETKEKEQKQEEKSNQKEDHKEEPKPEEKKEADQHHEDGKNDEEIVEDEKHDEKSSEAEEEKNDNEEKTANSGEAGEDQSWEKVSGEEKGSENPASGEAEPREE